MKTFDRRARGTTKLSAASLSAIRDKPFYDSQSSSQDSPSPQGVSKPANQADPYDFDVDKTDVLPGPEDGLPRADHAAASTGQELECFSISRPPDANKAAGKPAGAYGSGHVHKRSLLGARSSRASLSPLAANVASTAAAAQAQTTPALPASGVDCSDPMATDADVQHTSNPAPAAAGAAGVKRPRHTAQQVTQQAAPVAADKSGSTRAAAPPPAAAAVAVAVAGSTGRVLANSQSAQPQLLAAPQQAPRLTSSGGSQAAPPAAAAAAVGTGRRIPTAEAASHGLQSVPCGAGSAQPARTGGGPNQMKAGAAPPGSIPALHTKQGGSSSSGGGKAGGRGMVGSKRGSSIPSKGSQGKAAQAAPGGTAGGGGGGGGDSQEQEARPVQTIMEAQERGELVALQDGARYALDGLTLGGGSAGGAAAREGALALAELLGSRKGRLALRADGLAQQALSAAAKACAGTKDEVLLGAAALMLLCLSAEDAHPAYLASTAAACLMSQLLAPGSSNSSNGSEAGVPAFDPTTAWAPPGPTGQRLLQLANASPLVRGLWPGVSLSPHVMLLAALANATTCDAPARLPACDKLKANLGRYGVLGGVVGVLAAAAGAVAGTSSSMQPDDVVTADTQRVVAAAPLLRLGLVVLENSTFTCPANSTALLGLDLPGVGRVAPLVVALARALLTSTTCAAGPGGSWGSPGSSHPLHPPSQPQQEQQEGVDRGAAAVAALQAALSVLMNLSHASDGGAAYVGSAGAGALAVELLGVLLGPAAAAGQAALAAQVLAHADLLAGALGLLINLASTGQQHTAQLLDATLLQQQPRYHQQQQQQQGAGSPAAATAGVRSINSSGSGCARGTSSGETAAACPAAATAPPGLLGLLCAVMCATSQEPGAGAASPRGATPPGLPAPSMGPALSAGATPGAWPACNSNSPPVAAAGSRRLARRSGEAGQLTEAALAAHGASSAASIVEVYSGVLLGSLVAASPDAAATVTPLLPGGNLGVVVAAVGRCLAFYVATGAISGSSRAKLEGLLEALQRHSDPSTMQE